MPWHHAAATAVLHLCDSVKRSEDVNPPSVLRASVFSPAQAAAYPVWSEKFRAGQLFRDPHKWHQVFAREGLEMTKKLARWVDRQGYGTYIEKDSQGKQPGPNRLSAAEFTFAQAEVDKWVASGAVQEIDIQDKHPRAVVCNVVVAYRDGQMERLCWSGVSVNEGVDDASFRMEQMKHVLELVEPGDFAWSLDFKKGFHQVPLDQTRDFLVFRLGDRIFRWNVLPMGLKSAPKDFSSIVKQVLKIFRNRGIRCCFYIDDIIFLARSMEEALWQRDFVLGVLLELGFGVSLEKSLLNPGQLIKHLGFDVCTSNCTIWVLPKKVERIRDLVHEVLGNLSRTTGYTLSKLLGLLRSNKTACAWASALSVGLAKALSTLPLLEHEQSTSSHRQRKQRWRVKQEFQLRDYSHFVVLTELAVAELRFWSKCIWKVRFSKFGLQVEFVIFTDACPKGFGFVFCTAPNRLLDAAPQFTVQELSTGNWRERCNASSTSFELLTMLIAMHETAERVRGKCVHIATDNVGAAFVASKGTTKSDRLHFWALKLLTVCWEHDVQLSTAYLAGDGIITSGADALSRGCDVYACVLLKEVFRRIWNHFGPMEVDAWSAAGAQHKHPWTNQFLPCISPFLCENRIGLDALSCFDASRRFFAFPPVPIIGRYVALVVRHRQPVVLVVPDWPTQSWWPRLVNQTGCWLSLGCGHELFSDQGAAHPFGRNFDDELALGTRFWAVSLFW